MKGGGGGVAAGRGRTGVQEQYAEFCWRSQKTLLVRVPSLDSDLDFRTQTKEIKREMEGRKKRAGNVRICGGYGTNII